MVSTIEPLIASTLGSSCQFFVPPSNLLINSSDGNFRHPTGSCALSFYLPMDGLNIIFDTVMPPGMESVDYQSVPNSPGL